MKLSRLRPLLAVAIAAVLLAGCGSPHRTVTAIPIQTVPGHVCTPNDYAMQCALTPPPRQLRRGVPPIAYGVDFAWGGPRSCAAMRAIGSRFGASYFSFDTSGKNWNLGLVESFHACGIPTVGVWETGATRAEGSFNDGFNDAFNAVHQAAALGWPKGSDIDYAIDCDCVGAHLVSYFTGVLSESRKLGYEDDAYGGYNQVLFLFQRGLVGHHNWQTYAWSGGLWLPASIAPLEQYLNGSSYDHDRAIAADYGQVPKPAPPKPPGPSIKQIQAWIHARNNALSFYHENKCVKPILAGSGHGFYCEHFAAQVVSYQEKLPGKRPVCCGPHRTPAVPVCQIVRPEYSIQLAAERTSYDVYQRKGCLGPAAPVASGAPGCVKLQKRAEYFARRARQTHQAWLK